MEVERLGLQHAVWRTWALDAWRAAGFTRGQRLIDVGCGPGYASSDLAEIVGPGGEVVAIDRSRRFLDFARERAHARRLDWIHFHERDLDLGDAIPAQDADGAWCRWVFAFVKDPRLLLARIHRALRPGGRLVAHEYIDYSTWRLAPRSEAHDRFVAAVMESWRAAGGEPDIGLSMPGWLDDAGFHLVHLKPIIHVVPPSHFIWQWPASFARSAGDRLKEAGYLTEQDVEAVVRDWDSREADPASLTITPAVLEIVAERRG